MPQGSAASRACTLVSNFVEVRDLGWVFTNELGLHVNREKHRTRGADVVFISYKRLPRGKPKKGFLTVPPELIVEVFGEEDTWEYMEEKIKDYHEFGVDLVWVALPDTTSIKVFPRGGTPYTLGPNEFIDGGAVLPGFRVLVSKFFW
jgi:Uma2 family endonuclease